MYARIINGIVHNPVNVASQDDVAKCFHPSWLENVGGVAAFSEVPAGTMHGASDNGDGTFTNPTLPGPVKSWSELQFQREFTRAERKTIRAAAASNQDVDDFVKLLEAAGRSGSRILATDQDVIDGLNALESGGIIGEGRAAEILGT